MYRFILFIFLFTNVGFGQLSNKHWLPPLHARDASVVNNHYVYLSTPEPTPFQVEVKTGDGTPIAGSPFTVSQGNPVTILVGNNQPSSMFLVADEVNIVNNKGLVFEATKDFYVTFKVRSQNHAEIIVAKGIPGIGTKFRAGSVPQYYDSQVRNFVTSFMATEDNTTVTVSDYDSNVEFIMGFATVTSDTQVFTLNKGQSVVLSGYTTTSANQQGFIGALIESDKPIAVTTGNALGGPEQTLVGGSKQDFNLDQIVSYDQIGNEYIVVRGNGNNTTELPLIIATQDNTEIFINGNASASYILNTGEWVLVPSTNYVGTVNQNMYINSSKPIYLYQILSGSSTSSEATTGLNFIPPLSCFFQRKVDLIPSIDNIGNFNYNTDIFALTETGSTVTINGTPTTAQPQSVQGNSDWVTYRIPNYTGNVIVESTGPLAVGVFGTDNIAVGFSGYYSGFGSEPRDTAVTLCEVGIVNLLEEIDGNPEPGGTWTPPLTSGNDFFDPTIDLPGIYNYTYQGDCEFVDVDITVAIEPAPFAGNDTNIVFCANDAAFDLFSLLGANATTNGVWLPALTSGTGVFNPAIDASGSYLYTVSSPFCEAITATVQVTVNTLPTLSPIADLIQCDDAVDNDDTNGFVTFDLTTKSAEIIGNQSNITISYHSTNQDAMDNLNPLTLYYSNAQPVFVRLTNTITNCFAVNSFNLVVHALPQLNTLIDLKQCDLDTDAITNFNLSEANSLITNTPTAYTFTYFTTLSDAELNTNEITNFQNYTSGNNGVVIAKVTNANNCYRYVTINLIVSATTIPQNYSFPIIECDDYININDIENDGYDYFDLTPAMTDVLGLFAQNQNLTVTFYTNEADALSEQNAIVNITNFKNTTPNFQLLYVRIDSNINNECLGLKPCISLTVNPIPTINLGEDFVLCIDPITGQGSQSIVATPQIAGNYSYEWTPTNPNINAQGNQSAIFNITQSGNYNVTVTNNNTLCEVTDSISVTLSSEPESVSATLLTPLFSPGLSTIEAIAFGGFGTYEYSIDNGLNWQSSPIFSGVQNGSHIILVRDVEQCNTLQTQRIQTVTYPVFFTPNGDGINDYWNISGLMSSYDAKIYIFDRYGKLLKELFTNFQGWDGTFNGQPLPATDYWFKVEFTQNNIKQEFKSHFALLR